MRHLVPLVLIAMAVGCGRDRSLSAGPLAAPTIRFEHAVYLPPSVQPPADLVARLARPGVTVRIEDDVPNNYGLPPDPEMLKLFGRGLTPADRDALRKATHAIVLEFEHPQKDAWRALRQAAEVTAAAARSTGGWAWDEMTREMFTAAEWERRRIASWTEPVPDVSDHIVIHFYKQGEYVRAISLGMAKFGLPDIVMDDITWSLQRPVTNTITLLGQALVEGTPLAQGGTLHLDIRKIRNAALRDANLDTLKFPDAGAARLLLLDGDRDEGDPDNRLIEIAFDSYPGNDSHAKREAMLDALFGSTDEIQMVDHDARVLEASRKARERLPELRAAFNAGLAPGELILVKAPFPTDSGGNEWMWVEVTRWNGDAIHGTLRNEPNLIRDLHAGQMVDVNESDVFDYIRRKPDGSQEGNTTAALLSGVK
jgi:uncharacterized protein YegJ (DUF2314 family)